jgi:hypothetical protein
MAAPAIQPISNCFHDNRQPPFLPNFLLPGPAFQQLAFLIPEQPQGDIRSTPQPPPSLFPHFSFSAFTPPMSTSDSQPFLRDLFLRSGDLSVAGGGMVAARITPVGRTALSFYS